MRVEIPRYENISRRPFYSLRDEEPLEPEPVVWELGVTTCIVATSFERNFVAASDTRLSFSGKFSVDDVIKADPFHGEWTAMIAGDDISDAVPVVERATKILRGKGHDFLTVIAGFKQAYQEHRQEVMTDQFLSTFQMTIGEFKRGGKQKLESNLHADLSYQMKNFNLGCAFLVFGYDSKKQPHIFEVRNPGKVTVHDKPGFWAIGTGATPALMMLAFLGQAREVTRLPATIYNVLAAKFASETASDVGPKTFLTLHEHGSYAFSTLSQGLPELMRKLWDEKGKPKLPAEVNQIVEQAAISFWKKPKRKREGLGGKSLKGQS